MWYMPSEAARKNVPPGTTVDSLKQQGAVALNADELKALIVEKSIWLQNTVTGDKFIGARGNEFGYANYEIIPAESSLNAAN